MFTTRPAAAARPTPPSTASSNGGDAPSKASRIEVLSRRPSISRGWPPILFVHGAWHAAWCWSEFFLDYFAAQGLEVHALSLRGHGASEGRDKLRSTRIRDYVADVAEVAAALSAPPILVGHSMGGFVVQKFLQSRSAPAAVLLASVPPTGVWRTLARTALTQPLDVLKCNLSFSLWPVVSDVDKAQRLLFSPTMSREDAARYHSRLQDEAWFSYLDSLAFDLVAPKRVTTPVLVMGASDDAMVHPREIAATAKAYNVAATMFEGLGHDMMLDTHWRRVADAIIAQLERQMLTKPRFHITAKKAA